MSDQPSTQPQGPYLVPMQAPEISPLHQATLTGHYYEKRYDETADAWMAAVWDHDVPEMRAYGYRELHPTETPKKVHTAAGRLLAAVAPRPEMVEAPPVILPSPVPAPPPVEPAPAVLAALGAASSPVLSTTPSGTDPAAAPAAKAGAGSKGSA